MSTDVSYKCTAVRNCITLLTAEILRISKQSYFSWKNKEHIRNLDDQIRYLEEVLAAYERDAKNFE